VSLAGDVLVLDSGLHRSDLLLRAAMQAAALDALRLYPATAAGCARPRSWGDQPGPRDGRLLTTATDRSSLLDGLARTTGSR